MEKLTTTDVLHVAHLARLDVNEVELCKYERQLNDILSDIDKINQVDVDQNTDILIAPTKEVNRYHMDQVSASCSQDEMMRNTKHRSGDYMTVPKVLND